MEIKKHFRNPRFYYQLFWVCNILVLIFKISYSFITHFSGGTFEDWRIAENLAQHGTYAEFLSAGATAYKLPAYPVFLSFFIEVFPEYAKEMVVLTQHLIFFFVPFLIFKILKVFHKQDAGLLAAFLFIFSPAYFYYSNIIEVTNLFIPLFLLWILQYLKIYQNQRKSLLYLISFGILTAILFLTQVVVIPLAIIMLCALVFLKKINLKKFAILGLVAAISYSPWVIRNYRVFDKFIPSKTPVWQNLYFGFVSDVNVIDQLKIIPNEHASYVFQKRKNTDEFEMEKIYKDELKKDLNGRYNLIFIKAVQNAGLLWYVPSRYFYDNSLPILLGRKIYVIVLNFITLLALFHLYRKNKLLCFAFILLFINFTIPYMIGHAANTRFKLDFEYFQLILAAYFLTRNKKTVLRDKMD